MWYRWIQVDGIIQKITKEKINNAISCFCNNYWYLVVDLNFYLGGNIELYVIITWDIDSSIFSRKPTLRIVKSLPWKF